MLLTTLPGTKGTYLAAWPREYGDHFLFYENLQRPYHCREQEPGLGLLMTAKGSCQYIVNGTRNSLSGNQLFLVNRHSRLAIHIDKKETAPALLFFHSGLPDLVQHSLDHADEKLLQQYEPGHCHDFSYLERIHHNPALAHTLQTLVSLGSSCSSFASLKADIMIRNLFEQLLIDNRSAAQVSKNIVAIKHSTRLEIFKRISLAKEWIEANSLSAISLAQMAAVANMNSQHFLRMFRQVYRITPHRYLVNCKLEKAKELLLSTHLPVMEICQAIGFESVQSFSLLFRKRFGRSPRKFSIFDK